MDKPKMSFKTILYSVIAILVLVIAVGLFISYNHLKLNNDHLKRKLKSLEKETTADTVSIVFEHAKLKNELVVSSIQYQDVEKASDSREFFNLFEIPFTENSYWYRYVGTIKVAVDLSKAELVNLDEESKIITISLEKPFVASNTPDMKKSGVLEENNNILNPIKIKNTDALRRKYLEKTEKEVTKSKYVMNESKQNAEIDMGAIFTTALGENYVVKIEWKDKEKEKDKEKDKETKK